MKSSTRHFFNGGNLPKDTTNSGIVISTSLYYNLELIEEDLMKKLVCGLILALSMSLGIFAQNLEREVPPEYAGSTLITHKVIVRLWSPDGPWIEYYHVSQQSAEAMLFQIADTDPDWDREEAAVRGQRGSTLLFPSNINPGIFRDDLYSYAGAAGIGKPAMTIDQYRKRFGINSDTMAVQKRQIWAAWVLSSPFPDPFKP